MPYSYVCAYCGKPFTDYGKDRKYCCRECYASDKREHSSWHTCQQCGKRFYDQKHKDRKYCSLECTHASQNLGTEERECPICRNTFTTTLRKPKKTCSEECLNKLKGINSKLRKKYSGGKTPSQKIEIACFNCGKKFLIKPSRDDGRRHFCSRNCWYTYLHTVGDVIKKCKTCGKEYKTKISQINHRGSNYCSRKCQAEGAAKRMTGEGNSNWKGGISYENYGPNWIWQRKNARRRDKYTCQVCGATKYTTKFIDVHHVVPFKTFNGDYKRANTLSNLICLCRSCHAKVENGIIECPVPRSRVTIH